MQKIVFITVCVFTVFILSCGSSKTEQSCVTAFDCPDGKVCSDGTCVDENSSNGTPEENISSSDDDSNGGSSELPDGSSSADDGETNDSGTPASETPDTPEIPDTPNDDTDIADTPDGSDADTPETPDIPNDNDAETPENPDTLNDNDAEIPETPDTPNDNDNDISETPDDTPGGTDDDIPEIPDTPEDNDTDTTDDSDTETNEDDPYSDWDSTPDDEVCPFVMNECAAPVTDFGCLPAMEKEYPNYCDGLDNDCDGKVDEGCFCYVGQTQPCFKGKPNQRNVGICQDGMQTCEVGSDGKTGVWSDCTGGISPQQDICDNADNDCNGCVDDDLCCNPPINCAYNIGTAQPFTYKTINGNEIYDSSHLFNDAATATWTWTLSKGPCDLVLGTTNFFVKGAATEAGLAGDGSQTTTVSGTGLSWFKVKFLLSGSYKLHLKVTRTNGEVYECEWILRVVSNGLRVELCWNTANDVDIDLHLGKNGKTSYWDDESNCFYYNCDTSGNYYDYTGTYPDWGYGNTTNYDANGILKSMPNPRLDLDNRGEGLKPENINLDNPNDGDIFKVLVHHYTDPCSGVYIFGACVGGYDYYDTHPVVNVYCGGTLKATYGVSPQVTLREKDDSWKVVEIKWVGDVASDECELTPNLGIVSEEVPSYSNW